MDSGSVYGGYASINVASVTISCLLMLASCIIAGIMNLIMLARSQQGDSVTGDRKREFWMYYRLLLYSMLGIDAIWIFAWTPFYMTEVLFTYYNDFVSKACFLIERGLFVLVLGISLINLLIFWFAVACEQYQVVFDSVRGTLRGAMLAGWFTTIAYTIFQLIVVASVQESQYFYSGPNYNLWIGVLAVIELCMCFIAVAVTLCFIRYIQRSSSVQRVTEQTNFYNPYGMQTSAKGSSTSTTDSPKAVNAALFIDWRVIGLLVGMFLLLVLPYDILQAAFSLGTITFNTYVNLTCVLRSLTACHAIVSSIVVIIAQNRKVEYY